MINKEILLKHISEFVLEVDAVILAMGAGKTAAESIHEYLKK